MPYTWGTDEILVIRGTYRVIKAEAPIVEIPLLSDGSSGPHSSIQQPGVLRKRASWDGVVTSRSDYDDLATDDYNKTTRTFTDGDSQTMQAKIESLSPARRILGDWYEYSITLVEA